MDPLLTKEIKSILEDVIDQKIGNLEKEVMGIKSTMTAQYLSSIGRFMEMEAVETVDEFVCCFHEGVEANCKNSLRSWIKKYTNALAMGDLLEAFSVLESFLNKANKNIKDTEMGLACKSDWKNILKILNRHKEIARDISVQFSERNVPADIGEINFNPNEMYDEIVFPLSHSLRIQIIHQLKSGTKRFTNLKNELKIKNTGLLVHHLKPLIEANIVQQDFQKRYQLTDKGLMIVKHFSKIFTGMHPEDEEEITLGFIDKMDSPNVKKLPVLND